MSHKKQNTLPLYDYIKDSMSTYFNNMNENDLEPENIYSLVMSEVEVPLLEATNTYTGNNQSEAAKMLGLNRGTFRKKLKLYGML